TELRERIIKSAIAVAVGGVVCFVFFGRIRDALLEPYCNALPEDDPDRLVTQANCNLIQTEPLEGFGLVLTVAGYGGLMLALPVVLWQLWQFIVPGLYPHEKRYAVPFVASGVVLFAFGSGLAYWSIPRALDFLLEIGGFEPLLAPAPYVSFVVKMLLAFGLGFQFPLILIVLQMVGIVEVDTLKKGRRYAIVGIVVLVAILTPSGDPITLIVLSIPMYIFYEASIVWGLLRKRRLRKAAANT
ncbi:MAG: twin-arginine translocase subunit TatC, partial [Acidimicrobiales bacterium]